MTDETYVASPLFSKAPQPQAAKYRRGDRVHLTGQMRKRGVVLFRVPGKADRYRVATYSSYKGGPAIIQVPADMKPAPPSFAVLLRLEGDLGWLLQSNSIDAIVHGQAVDVRRAVLQELYNRERILLEHRCSPGNHLFNHDRMCTLCGCTAVEVAGGSAVTGIWKRQLDELDRHRPEVVKQHATVALPEKGDPYPVAFDFGGKGGDTPIAEVRFEREHHNLWVPPVQQAEDRVWRKGAPPALCPFDVCSDADACRDSDCVEALADPRVKDPVLAAARKRDREELDGHQARQVQEALQVAGRERRRGQPFKQTPTEEDLYSQLGKLQEDYNDEQTVRWWEDEGKYGYSNSPLNIGPPMDHVAQLWALYMAKELHQRREAVQADRVYKATSWQGFVICVNQSTQQG